MMSGYARERRAPSWSGLLAAAREILVERAFCVTCGKPPDHVSVDVDAGNEGVILMFKCHGRRAAVAVDAVDAQIFPDEFFEKLVANSRVFLRSVATYGTVSPEARRERRERLRR